MSIKPLGCLITLVATGLWAFFAGIIVSFFLLSPVMVMLIPLFGNGGTPVPAFVEQAFSVVTVVVYVLQLGVFACCVYRLYEKHLPV
jgi:hypothetical protein